MRRRPDRLDALLEAWASWRVSYEIYDGTGDSSIARFLDPASGRINGSRVLWNGRMKTQLSSLNSQLLFYIGMRRVNTIIALYGMPGTVHAKAQQLNLSCRTLVRLRKKAREIARGFLPEAPYPYLLCDDKSVGLCSG